MAEVILKNIKKVYPHQDGKKKKKKGAEERRSNLTVTDEGVLAVHDFNLSIKDKEFIVLVGPSGCGKSTTLRMVAGLEEISGGELYIDGTLVNDVAPKDRDIAMVFQNYALYPHMTVAENMAFPLKLRKVPKEEIAQRVGDRLGDQMWEPLRHIRDDPALTGLQKLQAVFAASFAGQRQQQIAQTLPHLCSNPQFLAMELTNIEAHLAPECIAPMIRQGMADGSIHTSDANALAEALFVLADIWLSPQTRPTTPTEQRARNVVFQQMTHALGLDLLTDAQAEQLVQLCTPVKD